MWGSIFATLNNDEAGCGPGGDGDFAGGHLAAGGKHLGALVLFRHYTVTFLPTIKKNKDSQLCNGLSFIRIVRGAPGVVEEAEPL